jgi:calcineurin-like phosphoesterase family protein
MVWFTADTHFGHANIIKYSNRPFKNVQEHDSELIKRWNSKVGKNDKVFHLGDFCWWRHPDPLFGRMILDSLNGDIEFIRGNHDPSLGQMKKLYAYRNVNVHELLEIGLPDDSEECLKNNGHRPVVLCHYGMRVWNRSHHGAFHLYGHSHGGLKNDHGNLMSGYEFTLSLDVGVDDHNYYPWSWQEIKTFMERKTFRASDHHSGKMDFSSRTGEE